MKSKNVLYVLFGLIMMGMVYAEVSVTTPTLTPADPLTANNLYCNTTVTGNETGNYTVYVKWLKENVVQATHNTNTSLVDNNTEQQFTLTSTNTAKNQNWSCIINATEIFGTESGWSAGATNVTINDTCPTASPTLSPTLIYRTTETVTATCGFADVDSDTEGTSTYKWFISGVELNGDTDTSLSNANFTGGDTIVFECTPITTDCSAARATAYNSSSVTARSAGGSGGGGGGGSSPVVTQQQESGSKEVAPPLRQTSQKTFSQRFREMFSGIGDFFRNFFARFKK